MKYQFIQAHRSQHRIERLCQVLAVSRSGYYAWRHRPLSARARANAALVERMTHLHRQLKERYGALKLWQALVADGVPCGRHRVARLRRQQRLLAKRTRRFRVMHAPMSSRRRHPTGRTSNLSPPRRIVSGPAI